MRKQTILNHLLLSTTVLGALMLCQLPTVEAETIAEASPASLETSLPSTSHSDPTSIKEGAAFEQAQPAENTEVQEALAENPTPTSTASPAETKTEENGSSAASPQDTENPTTQTSQPSAPDDTRDAETRKASTETVASTTNSQEAETSPTTQPETKAGSDIHQQAVPVSSTETIQNNNVGKNTVSITRQQPTPQTVKWTVTFDASNWGLSADHVGAFYFFTPKNANITSIVDNEKNQELIQHFTTRGLYKAYDETNPVEGLSKQWGWSVGNISHRDPRLDEWKNQGLFSKVFILNERKDKGPISFTITATLPDDAVQSFPFVAVMKRYTNIAPTEATSLAATTFEKEPKIILAPITPEPTPKNPKAEEPKSNPETPKENPSEQIQVTFKEANGAENTPDTATHYIFGGQIIKMVQPGTLLKSILPMAKIASPGYKPQKGDFILQKGYRIKGWMDENRNPISEDTLIRQSMILTPLIEKDDTTQTPEAPKVTPEKPKAETEAPKVTPEKPKSEPEAPKVTPEKPKSEPETPKATPENPKTEPEAPKVTPENPKAEPEAPKVTPENPKTETEAPKVTPEKPKSEPEAPKVTPEKPKSEPEAPKATPEKPKSEPEAPKVTPEKPKSEPEAPKATPEKPKTEPEAPKVTPEKPKSEPEAPKVTPEKPKSEPEAPKVTPEKPKAEPDAPKVTPEKPKSEPEAPKLTPEKPKTEPNAPKVTPEKPKSEPEAPKVTPEKPKSDPEAPKLTPEKPKTEPEAPKVTPEKPRMDQEAPKKSQHSSQLPGQATNGGQSNATSRPATVTPARKKATLPNTGEERNVLAWLGGILAAIVAAILALKPKNSKH